MKTKNFILACSASCLFTGLVLATTTSTKTAVTVATTSGIDLKYVDKNIRPQDDFFRYVNGKWLEKTQIPADRTNFGSFTELADEAEVNVRKIVEDAAKNRNSRKAQQVGDLYNSYMNEGLIEQKGLKPLAQDRKFIAKQTEAGDLPELFVHLARQGISYPFALWVGQDAKNAEEHVLYVTQSGLGLPDRDFYTKTDTQSKQLQSAYQKHIAKILTLANLAEPEKKAAAIYALETRMAEAHWTRVERRDANKTYNVYSKADLKALMPSFDWDAYLKQVGVAKQDKFIVRMPSYFEALNKVIAETPMATWRLYSEWHLLDHYAPSLTSDFVKANFEFYRKTLSGAEEMRPRWKRGIARVNAMVGEIAGELYVREHFKPEAKEKMKELVANLKQAYRESIETLTWMSPETKQKALDKLSKFTTKIGYPDKWRDYSDLEIRADDLVGNVKRHARFQYDHNLSKLGQPIDRDEWFMNPQTVNAYYSPLKNEIVFPAAILQPPFFDLNADPAVNYGGIGAVIGHEIGHGFDDQGSKYDGNGNLKNWWTDKDRTEFNKRAEMLASQYSGYHVLDGLPIDGHFTLGENIGDLGGLSIAYKAYQLSLKGKASPRIDGLSGEQRLFMGWAQIWRRKYRDEELRKRITTDSHSPSEFRVIGVLSNIPEFYSAFDVKEGDGMYIPEEKRVKIW